MKLNEKLMKLRKERGLSQEEFGNEINVSRQAVSKWEAGTTKPDIEKIKEISNYFDVSFDYLLNDEMDELEKKAFQTKAMKNKHNILKILLIIFIVYFIWSVYKFIALFRYYKIADSFSEEKFWMNESCYSYRENTTVDYTVEKIGNKVINYSYGDYNSDDMPTDENGNEIPHHIDFYDYDKKLAYTLVYDKENNAYYYMNNIDNYLDEEAWETIIGTGRIIKDNTFNFIPSNLKSILFASINPMYQVSIKENTIYINNFNKAKCRIILSEDGLITNYALMTEFDGGIQITYSYDYVQDHFNEKEIKDPLDIYKDIILNYSEVQQ